GSFRPDRIGKVYICRNKIPVVNSHTESLNLYKHLVRLEFRDWYFSHLHFLMTGIYAYECFHCFHLIKELPIALPCRQRGIGISLRRKELLINLIIPPGARPRGLLYWLNS